MAIRDTGSYFTLKQSIFAHGFKSLRLKHIILSFIFFIAIFAVCIFWIVTKNETRLVSSIPQPDSFVAPVIRTQPIRLDSLLIRLKTAKGFQISKMEITLHTDSFKSIGEIRQSMKQIRNHLVFILSDKGELVFTDLDKQSELKEEIARQLNVFLFTGQIKNIDIKQTILN